MMDPATRKEPVATALILLRIRTPWLLQIWISSLMSILELTIIAPVFKELEPIDEKKRPLTKFGELRLWG